MLSELDKVVDYSKLKNKHKSGDRATFSTLCFDRLVVSELKKVVNYLITTSYKNFGCLGQFCLVRFSSIKLLVNYLMFRTL